MFIDVRETSSLFLNRAMFISFFVFVYICRFPSEYIIIYAGRNKCHLAIKLSVFVNDDDACTCRGILVSQFCSFALIFRSLPSFPK